MRKFFGLIKEIYEDCKCYLSLLAGVLICIVTFYARGAGSNGVYLAVMVVAVFMSRLCYVYKRGVEKGLITKDDPDYKSKARFSLVLLKK